MRENRTQTIRVLSLYDGNPESVRFISVKLDHGVGGELPGRFHALHPSCRADIIREMGDVDSRADNFFQIDPMVRSWFFRFRNILSRTILAVLFFLQPLFLFADDDKSEPEWVLSYFLVLLCLGLGVLILLRPTKRSDSAFTQEELDKIREDKIKEMKKH